MKIVVIIPSLNEEENISEITEIIDSGLKRFYPNAKALILNVDSQSVDRTVKFFLETKTRSSKKSVINNSFPKGKGTNIYKALSLYRNQADYFLMLDADVVSANEKWIKIFLEPLIKDKSDLVIPIYTRNRYEGNTTNHFSSPVIYACLNKDITQPIAGDFSFTRELAQEIYKNISFPSDFKYGIDTVITWTAILNKHRILQIVIGEKIHKPSFPKIVTMFEEVANSTFRLVNENRKNILKYLGKEAPGEETHRIINDIYVKKPSAQKIEEVRELARKDIVRSGLPTSISKKIRKVDSLGSREWVEILSEYLCYILEHPLKREEISLLSKVITSQYLFRVLGYFKEADKASSIDVEKILLKQKHSLKKLLIKKCLRNRF